MLASVSVLLPLALIWMVSLTHLLYHDCFLPITWPVPSSWCDLNIIHDRTFVLLVFALFLVFLIQYPQLASFSVSSLCSVHEMENNLFVSHMYVYRTKYNPTWNLIYHIWGFIHEMSVLKVYNIWNNYQSPVLIFRYFSTYPVFFAL